MKNPFKTSIFTNIKNFLTPKYTLSKTAQKALVQKDTFLVLTSPGGNNLNNATPSVVFSNITKQSDTILKEQTHSPLILTRSHVSSVSDVYTSGSSSGDSLKPETTNLDYDRDLFDEMLNSGWYGKNQQRFIDMAGKNTVNPDAYMDDLLEKYKNYKENFVSERVNLDDDMYKSPMRNTNETVEDSKYIFDDTSTMKDGMLEKKSSVHDGRDIKKSTIEQIEKDIKHGRELMDGDVELLKNLKRTPPYRDAYNSSTVSSLGNESLIANSEQYKPNLKSSLPKYIEFPTKNELYDKRLDKTRSVL
jgi:hypothetical protein